MMLLQIKVMNGKYSSVIHAQEKWCWNTFNWSWTWNYYSETTQRHDNYTEQLVLDCNDNGNDGWSEIEERTSGVTDTLLQEPDMTENVEKIITFAPLLGNKPFGIIIDKNSEFLSFPSIYCDKTRADN